MTEKKNQPEKKSVPKTEYAVVGGGKRDSVSLTAIVYQNPKTRKSLSVHHLQRRLVEWGYGYAGVDVDGYYSEHTRSALESFKADQGIDDEGVTLEVLAAIFEGDTNVEVTP